MRPPDLAIPLAPSVSMPFQLIPAGCFVMGARGDSPSAEPRHVVRITKPFYLGRYPVTQAQFGAWTREVGRGHKDHFERRPHHPAENMSWDEAMRFCEWVSTERCGGLPPGHVATLPTEAQWEYACRAGTDTEYYTGDGVGALEEAAWFGEDWETGSTHPVGQKAPNGFGLYDMHGNVWEWCRDAWDEDAYTNRVDGVEDPEVRAEDVRGRTLGRVIRGGSWIGTAWDCRSACRFGRRPDVRWLYPAGNYMHRQRDELGWIRAAINSLAFPYQPWGRRFAGLEPEEQIARLQAVSAGWVREQAEYYARNSQTNLALHHLFRAGGWGCALAGLVHLVLLWVSHVFIPASASPALGAATAFVGGLYYLGTQLRRRQSLPDHGRTGRQTRAARDARSSLRRVAAWLFPTPAIPPAAGLVLAITLPVPFLLPDVGWLPDVETMWIIVLGVTLIIGAILVAWAEKSLYAEHARQYQTMNGLFAAAEPQLQIYVSHIQAAIDEHRPAAIQENLALAQALLFSLGKEALDEHAEWLILHRARPLEPFMPG